MAKLASQKRKSNGILFAASSILLGVLVVLWPLHLGGAEPNAVGAITKESLKRDFGEGDWHLKEPVDIGSKQMSVDLDSHTITFLGDVSVRQGDLQLLAREVTAVFGSEVNDILEIVAKGDVSVQRADQFAFGQEAVFDRAKATIVLTGNPHLRQGDNFIRGEKILVRLDEERMEVQGDVKAEFRPVRKQASPEDAETVRRLEETRGQSE